MELFNKWHRRLFVLYIGFTIQIFSIQAIEPEDILAPTVGPFVFLPKAGISFAYQDNVYLLPDSSDKIDDFKTTISPGLGVQYGQYFLDSNYISLNYSPSIERYSENSELNTNNHLLTFAIQYQKEGKFIFSGSDLITLDNNLLRGGQRSFILAVADGQIESRAVLVERFSSLDDYRFEYIISPKTSVYAATSYSLEDYDERPHYYYADVFGGVIPYALYDRSSWNNSVGFGWQAFPRIKLYGNLSYGLTTLGSNLKSGPAIPDSDIYGASISAEGRFLEKLRGRIALGFSTRYFGRYEGFKRDPHTLPTFEADLTYDYSLKGEAKLRFTRRGEVSVINPNFELQADFIEFLLDQELGATGKFRANLNSIYRLDSFESKFGLENRFLVIETGLTYSINKYTRASFGIGSDIFDGNKGNIDYIGNRVSFGLSIGY
jgi:hypothetical protein